MHLVQQHVVHHGRPVAYYSDKHSIFKTTQEHCVDRLITDTQLHRALRTLGIELIWAPHEGSYHETTLREQSLHKIPFFIPPSACLMLPRPPV